MGPLLRQGLPSADDLDRVGAMMTVKNAGRVRWREAGAVGGLLGGGVLLLVFGVLFIIRGQVAVGIPGVVIGIGVLISYKLNGGQQRGSR